MGQQATRARLLWRTPEGEARESALPDGVSVVGRGAGCEVCVPDTRVSRRHAEIRGRGRSFSILDLGSVNGTCVNDEQITDLHRLRDGDRVRIGPVEFRFELLSGADASTGPESGHRPTHVVPEPAETPYLEVHSGPQRGLRFEIATDRVVIGRAGRGQQWDLVLQDRSVSRPHAQIVREADGFVLTDMQSANGTLVNGEEIVEPHRLSNGDVILLGEMVLVFQEGTRYL